MDFELDPPPTYSILANGDIRCAYPKMIDDACHSACFETIKEVMSKICINEISLSWHYNEEGGGENPVGLQKNTLNGIIKLVCCLTDDLIQVLQDWTRFVNSFMQTKWHLQTELLNLLALSEVNNISVNQLQLGYTFTNCSNNFICASLCV